MSSLTRVQLIAEARGLSGRLGQAIPLTNQFDWILKDITRRYPVLNNIEYAVTTVAGQSYVSIPSDYRRPAFKDQFFYSTYELDWIEPEEYFRNLRMYTDTASTPQEFTIVKDENRLYMWDKPDAATLSYLYFTSLHPKVNKSLAFTSGGGTNKVIVWGNTVTGETSTATMVVEFVRVTSGSWAAGTAAGTIIGTVTGTFQSETLKIGSTLDVASISGDATTADNFVHLLGEDFDDAIVEGLTWKGLEKLSGMDAIVRAEAKAKKADYLAVLADIAQVKTRSELKTTHRSF